MMFKRMVSKISKRNTGEIARLSDQDGRTIKKAIKTENAEAAEAAETSGAVDNEDESEILEENDTGAGKAVELSGTALVTAPNIDTSSALTLSPIESIIDTHHPHRIGSPILPLLPVLTSYLQIPEHFSPRSLHLNAIRFILAPFKLPLHVDVEVVHRHHSGKAIGSDTLTLVIQSHGDERERWKDSVKALQQYIKDHKLSLMVEVTDHRIFTGMFTLPILLHDPIAKRIEKKEARIRRILQESRVQWTSLEFWYRGVGPTRGDCKPTVLIGIEEPEEGVWWGEGGLVKKIREVVKGKMEVENCWREGKGSRGTRV